MPLPAALLLLTLLAAPPGLASGVIASGDSGFDPARIGVQLREILLGAPGSVFLCPECPDEPVLRVEVGSGLSTEVPLPYREVDQVDLFPGGKRVLVATSSEQGARNLLLVLSSKSLAPLQRVEIPGKGRRFAIGSDGYTVFALLQQPGGAAGGEPGKGKWLLVRVDLGASQVAETFPLSGEARDLALAEGGTRLFVAMRDRLVSFTTHPLRASWSYRSPGDNRRLFIRPGPGEIYVLRDSSLAIFKPSPGPPAEGATGSRPDDAAWILDPPAHLDRLGFSPDGGLAVGAGRGIDAMLVLDAGKRRFVGTWPEDTPAIGALMAQLAAPERRPGPRGKVASAAPGFGPPLQELPGPGPPPQAEPPSRAPRRRPAGSSRGRAAEEAPAPPASPSRPPAALQEIHVPGPVPTAPPEGAAGPGRGVSPLPGLPTSPETSSVEEVAQAVLAGRIRGEKQLVASVILLGPNSLIHVQAQVTPAADGTYSFDLPPSGRYRIVPVAEKRLTLACRPAFLVVQVGEFGFRGLDFQVLGAVGGKPGSPGR